MRTQVTISFDVDSSELLDYIHLSDLRTEMWDYVAKLVRTFNVDHTPKDGELRKLTARFITAKILVVGQ